jgi:hypothetical protein
MRVERARVAEDLGQAVNDGVDVVAQPADEVAVRLLVEVADEICREGWVVERFLEDGAFKSDVHPWSVLFRFSKIYKNNRKCQKITSFASGPRTRHDACVPRGRPSRDPNAPAQRVVGIRLSEPERAKLKAAAGFEPLASWIRRVALEAADRALTKKSRR